jgi:hypothetical protein
MPLKRGRIFNPDVLANGFIMIHIADIEDVCFQGKNGRTVKFNVCYE